MSASTDFACALSPQQRRERRNLLRNQIVSYVSGVTSLTDGIRINFVSNDNVRTLVDEFVSFEKGCCQFLAFTVSESGQRLSLVIQGPPEAAETINLFRQTALGQDL